MNQYPFTVFKLESGEIIASGIIASAEDAVDGMLQSNLNVWGAETHGIIIAESDTAVQYVVSLGGDYTVMERPVLPVQIDKTEVAAGDEDSATLTSLPDPCTIIIDDPDPTVETHSHEVAGGGFLFGADDRGVYTIEVRRWPFLPFRVEITAI